jgi:hypothetical protein
MAELIERFHQTSSRGLCMRQPPCFLEQLSEVGSAEKWHAQKPQASLRVIMDGMDRNDMSVLEPSEKPGFVSLGAGDLQGHQATPQVHFLRQEDARERTPPEFHDKSEATQFTSNAGKAQADSRTGFLARGITSGL